MKNLSFLSGCLAAVMVVVSCEKRVVETDFTQNETPMVPVTLTGSIPETRVSLDGTTPKWTAGDQISVITTDGTLCPAFTADQGGAATTTFSGTKPDGSTLAFAVFPYSTSISKSGSNYTLTLPATQDGTLGNAMMAAQIPSGEGEMVFSNLLTLVKVTIPSGMSLKRIELRRSDRVSGSFTVNGSTLAVTPAASPAEADKGVAVEKASGLSGVVYLSVLPSSSKQIDLLLTRNDGKMALVSKTLETAYVAGHLKKATVPSNLTFSDVARIGSGTSSQQYATTSQPSKPQINNAGFEDWLDSDNLPKYWNSYQTFEHGWLMGSGYNDKNRQVKKSTDKRPGSSGTASCALWSRTISTVVAQGNLTTGKVHAYSWTATGSDNYNYTKRNSTTTVGGFANPHYQAFTARPDSMAVWVKCAPAGTDANHPYAKVQAILHTNVDYISGYAQNTGGTAHIGEAANQQIPLSNRTWTRLSIPFIYDYSTTPSYILINIATNSYPGGGTAGDYMYIDDIEMIYNLYKLRTDSNGWATLCLGYNALIPSGVTAYYVTEVTGGYARLTAIPSGQVLPKETAVLVKGSANATYDFNGRGTDVQNKTVATVGGNLLRGTTKSISRPSGTCRVLSSESTGSMAAFGAFTGSTIAANTAWLTQ